MLRVAAAREIATRRHVKRGQFEIDTDSDAAVDPDGIWIAAWVFISNDDIAEELGAEDAA